jgi:hypothetical protein
MLPGSYNIAELANTKQSWNLKSNLIFPDDDKISFYYDLLSEVSRKGDEGFPTQIVCHFRLCKANADHVDRLLGAGSWGPPFARTIPYRQQPELDVLIFAVSRQPPWKCFAPIANHHHCRVSLRALALHE